MQNIDHHITSEFEQTIIHWVGATLSQFIGDEVDIGSGGDGGNELQIY